MSNAYTFYNFICFKDYNADVIYLQECEREFFRDDLMASLSDQYEGYMKLKGDTEGHEGEAILFRSDRFRYLMYFHNYTYKTLL